jgi:hypothetical protein
MIIDSDKAARIGNDLICRVQRQNTDPEEIVAATAHISAAVERRDFELLNAIDQFTMIRVDTSTIVTIVNELRAAGRHEDVELLTLDHVLSYYDLLSSMNRVDGSVSASDSNRQSAATLLASLFSHTHQTKTVLTLIRRERLTNPESIMDRVRETLQIARS